jgi:XTP/dITP diphosphohydrolase
MNQFPPFELLIATTNPGKMLEIQRAFSDLPLMLRSLDEFPDIALVEETGTTYEENALLKALNYAEQTRCWALADDSGLEVTGLNGLPGVRSARYGGANASDGERTQKLIRELDGKAFHKRSARFVCCVAFAGWKARDPSCVLG